jgi:predicted PurR-regulated permease PerM
MPGWLAMLLSILMVVLILGLVIATVFFSITQLFTQLPTYLTSSSAQAAEDVGTTIQIEQVTTGLGPIFQGLLATIMSWLTQFGLALVIFCFLLSAALSMPTPSRLGLDPNYPAIGRVTSLTEDVRKYMTVLTRVNLFVGLGNTVFLWILGVDYALLWGLLAWFMGYIPSIGFLIALVPPVLMAYAQYGIRTALIVLIGYIVINGGVENFYKPKVMGDQLKISPVVVFIGLFVWGFLLGGIGAIMSVPLTMLVLIIMENFAGTRPVAILMRYTGAANAGERQEALQQVKGVWGRVKNAFKVQL